MSAEKTPAKQTDAGWSSQVAREAHNLEVAGSNPVPAIFLKLSPKRNLSLPVGVRQRGPGFLLLPVVYRRGEAIPRFATMPKFLSVPRYRRHKASGQAVVRPPGGDIYFGTYGSAAVNTHRPASSKPVVFRNGRTEIGLPRVLSMDSQTSYRFFHEL
jgi:hypothetical protein